MQYQVSTQTATEIKTGCIVVTLDQSGKLSNAALELDKATNGLLTRVFQSKDIEGKLAQNLLIPAPANINAERILFVGTGKEVSTNKSALKVITAIAAAVAKLSGSVSVALADLVNDNVSENWLAQQLAMALGDVTYRYSHTKTKNAEDEIRQPDTLIWLGNDVSAALEQGDAIAQGVAYAKELGNLPPNICTPTYLAEQAQLLGANDSLKVTIIDEEELEKMGAGAFVSVSKGSYESGKIIIMEYFGDADNKAAPHMILGKGIKIGRASCRERV